MENLPWIIYGPMKPNRRVKLLRRARHWYEGQLGEAEAEVIGIQAALALIDEALADFGAESCMLGGKQESK